MRLLFSVALVGLLAATSVADDTKDTTKRKPGVSLQVGDAAPSLKASKWLQGDEVKEFDKGKIYIVEFWATWCGPCIVMMPHMAELQAQYKDKGVTFIGYSARDPNNTQEKVTAFVKKRGPKLKYTFAYSDDRDTYDAWMTASGQTSIPCCFVVDKASKIAYIGHPLYLDVILPKVVAGTWKGKESAAELAETEKEVNAVFEALGGRDSEATLKKLRNFEKKNPALANIPYFIGPKLDLLVKTGRFAEAKKMARTVMAKAIKQDDPMALRSVSAALRTGDAKANKDLMALAMKAAETMVQVAGDKDWSALLNLASTYFAAGDLAKARAYGQKAIDAAAGESAGVKRYIQGQVKKFESE